MSKANYSATSIWLKKFFASPVFLIIFWFAAVVLGIYFKSGLNLIVVICALILVSLVSYFLVKRLVAVFLVISSGLIFVAASQYFSPPPIGAGCQDVNISSAIYQSGNSTQFAANKSGGRVIIDTTATDHFGYGDLLKLCFKSDQTQIATDRSLFYKARFKTDFLIKNPEIEIEQTGHGLTRSLYNLAGYLRERTARLFSGNSASLAMGLILGGSAAFSDDFKQFLQRSGTTHLVAVSGYNVSIITVMLFNFVRSHWSRRAAIALTVVVLVAFCIMTGASSSVLRASIMGGLYVLGKAIGRRSAVINSLFVGGFIMTLSNPFVVFDIGFQLSFMATLGLVLLEQPIYKLLFSKIDFNKFVSEVFKAFSTTLAAQIFTFPILLYSFGAISILAPIANLLILPLIPMTMGILAISLAASLIYFKIGLFIGGLAQILLSYHLFVIKTFGQISFAGYKVGEVSLWWIIALYILIFSFTILMRNLGSLRRKKEFF